MSLLILPAAAGAETTPAPTVTGGTDVGMMDSLTATANTPGDEIDWQTCDATGNLLGSGPLVTNADTYMPTDSDVGTDVCAVETTTDDPPVTLVSASQGPITDSGETAPSFTGSPTVGHTLTAAPAGWTDPPDSIAYQWLRCTAPNGTGCSSIPGMAAQTSTYQLRPADEGSAIEVQETPVYGGTPATGAAQTTSRVNTVASAAPTVGGNAETGQTLTAVPVFAGDQIDWEACPSGNPSGTSLHTGTTYTVQQTDLNNPLCAVETTTDPTTLTSAPTAAVTDPAEVAPLISGTVTVGQTLTAGNATWGQDPGAGNIAYQWERCSAGGTGCGAITTNGANQTYQLRPTDAGHALEVQETPIYGGTPLAAATQTSLSTGAVASAAPTVAGTPHTGATLTATRVFGDSTVQWFTCPSGNPTTQLTTTASLTYTVQESDLNHPLCAVETTTDPTTLTSAPTAAVTDPAEVAPLISGTATVGQTLTAGNATWGEDPGAANIGYQWERCSAGGTGCSAITTNGTSQTYVLRPVDAGHALEVQETPSYGGTALPAATQTSLATGAVASAVPAIDNASPNTGQTLTATPVFGASTIQWFTCPNGNPTTQLTTTASVTYTVQETDLNHQLCAVETTTDPATLASSPTSAVTDPNQVPPTFNGQLNDGGTVTVTDGQWGQHPDSVSIQWLNCQPDGTSGCTPATGPGNQTSTYGLSSIDVSKAIEVRETPIYGGQQLAAVTQQSAIPNTVAVVPAVLQAAPSISGTPTVRATLTETPAQWTASDPPLTRSVAWQTPDGAGHWTTIETGQTYTIQPSDLGTTIRAEETATTGSQQATQAHVTADSNTIGPIGESTANTAPPTISGDAQVGKTLSASPGDWNPSPSSITFAYQWEDCAASACTPIAGATGSTYNPSAADLGQPLAVAVTPQIFSISSPSQQSAQTLAVTSAPLNLPPAPTNTGPPKISGAAQQGATLTASTGTWAGAPTGFNYQWLRCPTSAGSCVPLAGATSAGYVPTGSDAGHELAVIVAAHNAGGAGPAITSAHTVVIAATTTVQLTIADAHAVAGERSRLTVVVTSGSAAVTPAGTVTVTRGGKAVHGCSGLPVKGSGQSVTVRCTAHLDAGKSPLSAVFTPGGGKPLVASPAAARAISVARAPTTIVLNAPSRATTNARLTYSASVESNTGKRPTTGSVVFEDRGHPIAGCERQPIHAGTATCTLSYGLTGRHVITAHFDGAGNFLASTSGPTPERIAEPRAHGAITATLNWTFHFTPRYTEIDALALHRALRGSTLTMRCAGKGCPFASRTLQVSRSGQTVDLEHAFRDRRLGVRSALVITITRPSYVGKYYRFVIRARQEPKILISCLALGSDRPGVGCTRP